MIPASCSRFLLVLPAPACCSCLLPCLLLLLPAPACCSCLLLLPAAPAAAPACCSCSCSCLLLLLLLLLPGVLELAPQCGRKPVDVRIPVPPSSLSESGYLGGFRFIMEETRESAQCPSDAIWDGFETRRRHLIRPFFRPMSLMLSAISRRRC
jgi:hypothetical protein